MADLVLKGGAPNSTTIGVPFTPLMVDATYNAARVTLKPDEYNFGSFNGGHYRTAQVSGALTGVGAAGAVFSMRWANTNGLFLLKRLLVGYAITTAFTAGQLVDFDVVRDSAFTAADTGGTALTPFIGNNAKKRSSTMATSQVADMRISSTAALGAGTKTADTNPFGYATTAPTNLAVPTATVAGGFMQLTEMYVQDANAAHPEMFGANEGFNIRNVTAMGAAGVIKLYVVCDWAEVPGL